MYRWLAVLLAIWVTYRINELHERHNAKAMKLAQAERWKLTVSGAPIAPEMPTRNKHVLRTA